MRKLSKIVAIVLSVVIALSVMTVGFTASAETLINLFDKSSSDIWQSSLTYNGSKLTSASYANIFTTHKINVAYGDTIYWGYFGAEDYCMEIYDANGNFLKQVKTAEVTANYTGASVNGVSNNPKSEAWYYYTITTQNAGYVRILGNTATMGEFQVYLNLSSASQWPGKNSGSGDSSDLTNLFDKNSSDIWRGALTYNGSKLESGSYANIFTTHKITVKTGDTIYWGYFGAESYCMEIYDANGNFLKQVSTAEVTATYTGVTVTGVSNNPKSEAWYYYKITTSNAGYVRILGNISTMDSFQVYLNLSGASQWPGKPGGSNSDENSNSVLYGKSVLFCGDSITNAVKDEKMPYYGWAGRIGTAYGMAWTNAGVSGASLSTIKSSRIISQLHSHKNQSYNYVILHGGVNDAMTSGPIGTLNSSFNLSTFDTSTMAGALDEMFYYAKQYWPNAKIGYIVNYATPNSDWGGNTKDMSAYFAMAKQVCDKWQIPYIDLYSGYVVEDGVTKYYSNDILKVNTGTNFYNQNTGEVHIGSSGYILISPYIATWMEGIGVTEPEPEPEPDPDPEPEPEPDPEPVFETNEIERNNDLMLFSNAWVRRFNKNLSGRYAYHTSKGGKIQFTFTGTQFEIVSYKSPSQGKIYLSINDGEEFLAADLYDEKADTYFKEVVYSGEELEEATYTVTIRVEGKAYIDALNIKGELEECVTPIKDYVTLEVEGILDAEYTGIWSKKYAWKHSGHNAMYSQDDGSVTFDFVGDEISVLSYKGNTQGYLFITVDDEDEQDIRLYDESSDTLYAQTVFTKKFDTYGTHTITICTEGKAYVDAVVIRRNMQETVTYEGETETDFMYEGNWSAKSSWSHSNHMAAYTSTGGSVSFSYTGYDFKILSYKAKTQGKMYVSVDGSDFYEVDLYDNSSDKLFKTVVFDGAGMDYGKHTVTVQTSGKVYFDAVKIDGTLDAAPIIM